MINQFILKLFQFHILALFTVTAIIPAKIVKADTSSADYIFLIDNSQPSCQQMGKNYQEVKTFETETFYINICQQDNNYYYLGEAKTGNINTIFLPANALESGEMYRANNGNIAYIVTILPNQAVLTIERNGVQVAIENSLENKCLDYQDIAQIQGITANQMSYSLSDARTLTHNNHFPLHSIEIIDFRHFYEFSSLAQYNPEAILNIPSCK